MILVFLALLLCVDQSFAQVDGIYCGKQTCYEVLNVNRNDDKGTIMRAYRKLARVHHPDRQKTENTKAAAEKQFRKIAQAYEILRDDEQRKEYDYMLDNPDQMYYHYYQYYRRRYAQKVDVRIVIFVLISLISAAQYYAQWSNYNEAITYLTREPKYRFHAKEIAKKDGLLYENLKKDKTNRKWSKEEIRNYDENIIRNVITEKMQIKGGYSKPSIKRILFLQLVLWPVQAVRWLAFWARWFALFWILKRPYSREDKLHIIHRYMNVPQMQWEDVEKDEKDYYLELELWKWEKFSVYKSQKEEDTRKKLAEDNNYKRYRRYMKKGGAGQIVFGPEDGDGDY